MTAQSAPAENSDNVPTTPSGARQKKYFFKNSAFEYVFLTCLGRAYNQVGDVGKVLYLIRQVEDGNFESAFTIVKAAGDEARALPKLRRARAIRRAPGRLICGRRISTTLPPTSRTGLRLRAGSSRLGSFFMTVG